jgi:hypothetical protein
MAESPAFQFHLRCLPLPKPHNIDPQRKTLPTYCNPVALQQSNMLYRGISVLPEFRFCTSAEMNGCISRFEKILFLLNLTDSDNN